jgi:hypothetical protein
MVVPIYVEDNKMSYVDVMPENVSNIFSNLSGKAKSFCNL